MALLRSLDSALKGSSEHPMPSRVILRWRDVLASM
jgi:hypothetical protein